jgi:hypothetical protein
VKEKDVLLPAAQQKSEALCLGFISCLALMKPELPMKKQLWRHGGTLSPSTNPGQRLSKSCQSIRRRET